MSTQEIERLIADLEKGQQELARRDREHDEHIIIMLGQIVTLLPEVRSIQDRLNAMDTRFYSIDSQLTLILQKLDETSPEVY